MKKEPKTMAEGLIQGLQEAAQYKRGQLKARERVVEIPKPAPKWTSSQIRKMRKEIYGMSQPVFAAYLNVTPSTVRSWEQGQKEPSGAAARLLQLLSIDYKAFQKLGF